ncbi:MAG: SDR family oxidoreductase [Holophaga sp.]|nr:SDR family oxidoreductase [Holophaga sp.]
MELGITGRVAMVAAASKGLGKAAAAALVKEGCRVSICGRDQAALEAARAELGGSVLAVPCDVTNPTEIEDWFKATLAAFGQVDILVTNTGGPPAATFLDLTEAQWESGVQSTLLNVVRMSRLVLPGMRERKWGRIVHITSLVAKQPAPLLTISSTLRAGLSALTKTMATEFGPDNVLVNALLPGHVMTDRQLHLAEVRSQKDGTTVEEYFEKANASIPVRRLGRPEEIGDVIAFLCSDRASYLTGSSIQVDGGIIQGTL